MGPTPTALDRRSLLRCAGIAGAGLCAATLAACGGGDDPAAATTTTSAGAAGPKTSDIPVGGGKVFADAGYVITQPTAGDFKAFTSKCTHMQLPVGTVANGTINCLNHGSKFDIATGAVKHGPATAALPAKTVAVNGDTLTVS
ncbi:MAG TPA: Rieske (2Fe-2S) protein [Dermatophilaceae bacterium]|nr:Rieske (2Fe-2S) protein [Dermatophilaceae bacterium]